MPPGSGPSWEERGLWHGSCCVTLCPNDTEDLEPGVELISEEEGCTTGGMVGAVRKDLVILFPHPQITQGVSRIIQTLGTATCHLGTQVSTLKFQTKPVIYKNKNTL